jgi:hypothetical protein
MFMQRSITVVCWKGKRCVEWAGTIGENILRRAILSPREAPSSILPTLRQPTATLFNKVPIAVVYWPGKTEIDYGLKSWFYGLTWSIFSAVEQLES